MLKSGLLVEETRESSIKAQPTCCKSLINFYHKVMSSTPGLAVKNMSMRKSTPVSKMLGGRHGCDRMVIRFTTTLCTYPGTVYAISAYHH